MEYVVDRGGVHWKQIDALRKAYPGPHSIDGSTSALIVTSALTLTVILTLKLQQNP